VVVEGLRENTVYIFRIAATTIQQSEFSGEKTARTSSLGKHLMAAYRHTFKHFYL